MMTDHFGEKDKLNSFIHLNENNYQKWYKPIIQAAVPAPIEFYHNITIDKWVIDHIAELPTV
jgi:hypothetical protein